MEGREQVCFRLPPHQPLLTYKMKSEKLTITSCRSRLFRRYMNIALEQTEEYVNGQLKNKYGDAFLRGNNVLYISTQKRRA